MSQRRISLAAGIMPEATPGQLVEAAAAAQFDFGGMWVEREDWTSATTRAIKRQLADAQVELLDLEVAWIMPGEPDPWLLELVEIAAELGAANLLCVSSDPDMRSTTEKLQAMCDRAAGTAVRVNLEFGLFTEVKSIRMAQEIVDSLEGNNKGLLCDALHWSRSGGTADDIANLPTEWIGYAQLCDAPAEAPDLGNMDAIIDDAINRRCPMGAGGLPLAEMVKALPAQIPFAIEERSEKLRTEYPNLNERAKAVAKTSRDWFAQQAENGGDR